MKIYLKLEKQPDTLEELIDNMFNYIKGNQILTTDKTYFDEECTEIQCHEGKYRSLDDLYDIATTYFPDITIIDFYKELLLHKSKLEKCKNHKPYLSNCDDIKRITFFYYIEVRQNHYDCDTQHDSQWSHKELLEQLNIKNTEDLKKYIENEPVIIS